ncbi:MAG: DUF1016 N-terminal domain-containing protein [Candidatus Marinimicrobia bacterium]|nr:DUF1016 N-terminal domain-containing protein [Candidatus Neomarinimicrobiota bacterium]
MISLPPDFDPVNTLQVMTNFEIGRQIIDHEQQGAERAEYGKKLIKTLSEGLTAEFGRGFSKSNFEYMRSFYIKYQERLFEKTQTPSGELAKP